MNSHKANSIRWRGATGDALAEAKIRFMRKTSSVKFQAVTSSHKITETEGKTDHDDITKISNDPQQII